MSGQIRHYIDLLRRWWWLLVISALIPAMLSGLFLSRRPDLYQARATLMIGTGLQNPNPDQWQLSVANNLANAYARLAKERPVTEAVIARLGLDRQPEQLAAQIATRVYYDAQLLEIEVVDTDPRVAALIANALADELVRRSPVSQEDQVRRQAFIRAQLDELEKRIAQLDSAITDLQSSLVELTSAAELEEAQGRLAQLEEAKAGYQATYASLLSSYRTESPNVVSIFDPAVEPVMPLPRKDKLIMAVAAAAGVALAVAGVFVLDFLDDTVHWEGGWVRELGGVPVLGVLPDVKVGKAPLAASLRFRHTEIEAVRNLRTMILVNGGEKRPDVILVTSPEVGDGKTFAVVNLGMSIATTGLRVILVDANMRNPRLHEWFDQPNGQGLSDLLAGRSVIPDSWPPMELRPTGVDNLYLLPSGRPPADPAALLSAGRLASLVDTLKEYADVVLIDSPAGTVVPDAAMLAAVADRVLVVCGEGRTRLVSLTRLRDNLANGSAKERLGIALNRVKVGKGGGYRSAARSLSLEDPVALPVLGVAEAALLLGVSQGTVERWCEAGRLPARREGRRWLIPREELEHFVAAYSGPTGAGREGGEIGLPLADDLLVVAGGQERSPGTGEEE